jgi:uncharacterized protein (TIGR02266 family)
MSESDHDDRRRDQRFAVTLRVDYDDAADLVSDYTENLSNGGMCVVGSRVLPEGEAVRMTLSFPGLIDPIRIDGIVRWVRPGDSIMLGIEFVDGPARDQLAALVTRIREGDPALVKRTLRVLIVEDNPHVADMLRAGLGNRRASDLAVDCRIANDGREGLELLKEQQFDVLISDVYLPMVDGPTLIKVIRNELKMTIPIVAVSAGGESAKRAALAAGADIFIDKPMRLGFVLETIRQLIRSEPAK